MLSGMCMCGTDGAVDARGEALQKYVTAESNGISGRLGWVQQKAYEDDIGSERERTRNRRH